MKSKQALAELWGVTTRTLERWVAQGCPCVREPDGVLVFDEAQVRAWTEAAGIEGPRPRATDRAPADAARATARDLGARADAARKVAQARQQEHELQQEKGLERLGLADRVRAATTTDELVRLDLEVAALVAGGAMRHQRAQALRQLLAQAQRAIATREGATAEDESLFLVTTQARELAQAFDRIGNGWRRRWVVEAVRLHLEQDLLELPGWDGDMRPVLAALALDAMGEPTGDAWPARFAAPTVAPALVVQGGAA